MAEFHDQPQTPVPPFPGHLHLVLMDFASNARNSSGENASDPLISGFHLANRRLQVLCSLETEPVKYSIPEEEADNLTSKLSAMLREYFPTLDPEMVSQVVSGCVQNRIQITQHFGMVLQVLEESLIN
jgi:hypothetical protein